MTAKMIARQKHNWVRASGGLLSLEERRREEGKEMGRGGEGKEEIKVDK